MKTFFFSLFLLFLLAFGGAAAFLVTTLEPASFMREAERLGVFEAVEKYLPTLERVSGLPNLQEKAEQQLGLCRFVTDPDPTNTTSRSRNTEIKGENVPYLEPIPLENRDLLCNFNGTGKSVLVLPTEKSVVTIRRALDRSGTISISSGCVTVLSDKLDVYIAGSGLEVRLRSNFPAGFKLTGNGDSTPYTVTIINGQVDVSYRRLPGNFRSAGVYFHVVPGAQLSNAGQVLAKSFVKLLPSGFDGFESKDSATPANPAARHSLAARFRDALLNDPIHRPLIGKVLSLVDEVASHPVQMQLAAIFPRAFGIPFACGYQPAGGATQTVGILPGEWIDAPSGGKIVCPDHLELTLASGTRLEIRRLYDAPLFDLERGEAKVSFGEEDFLFSTPAYVTRVKGHAAYQQVTFSSTAGSQALDCGIGEVSASFAATDDTGPSPLLVSRNCRLEISPAEGAPRTLFSGEKIHFGNLSLANEFLPYVRNEELTKFTDYDFKSPVWLSTDPGSGGKLTVNLNGKYNGRACKLYAKKKDLDQFNLIRSFQGQSGMQLQVETQYVPGFVALVCTDGTSAAASSSVATVKQ